MLRCIVLIQPCADLGLILLTFRPLGSPPPPVHVGAKQSRHTDITIILIHIDSNQKQAKDGGCDNIN